MPDSRPTVKRKRSGWRPEVDLDADVEEGDNAEVAREYIKEFLELEDDENTNLANALNLATMAQV